MPPIALSICVPTYNFGKFIGDTLKSILCQTADGVEINVLDGASTDNTSDIVRQFQANYPNLKYH
jgi:abequosyltransferase